MILRILLLFLCGFGCTVARAADVEELVRQLGAASTADRNAAGAALWEIGTPAVAAVRRAAQSDDPEVRFRAKELLPKLEAGIRPEWDPDLQRRVLRSPEMSTAELTNLMDALMASKKLEALPFLAMQVSGPAQTRAADHLHSLLKEYPVERQIIDLFQEPPVTKAQKGLLKAALLKSGSKADLCRALTLEEPDQWAWGDANRAARKVLAAGLTAEDYPQVLRDADAFLTSMPDQPRFLYAKAIAYRGLGETDRASRLEADAIKLFPENARVHYRSGQFLIELRAWDLAIAEYKLVLTFPDLEQSDITQNLLGLASAYYNSGDYTSALPYFEKAHASYKKRKSAMLISIDGKLHDEAFEGIIAKCRKKIEESE